MILQLTLFLNQFGVQPPLSAHIPKFTLSCDSLLSQFSAPQDSLIYSLSLRKALDSRRALGKNIVIVDLGSGSGLPIFYLFKNDGEKLIEKVHAVEIDLKTLDQFAENIDISRVASNHFETTLMDMEEFLKVNQSWLGYSSSTLVVGSNPPYVPAPKSPKLINPIQIDGGPLGDKYILAILNSDPPPGSLLVLNWSSLTNPVQVIDLIESKYEVINVFTKVVPFGKYSGQLHIFEYLLKLRESNLIEFSGNTPTEAEYTIISTVLRRKNCKF